MQRFIVSKNFQSADIGGVDRRPRVEPGKLLALISQIKAASGATVKLSSSPVKTAAKAG